MRRLRFTEHTERRSGIRRSEILRPAAVHFPVFPWGTSGPYTNIAETVIDPRPGDGLILQATNTNSDGGVGMFVSYNQPKKKFTFVSKINVHLYAGALGTNPITGIPSCQLRVYGIQLFNYAFNPPIGSYSWFTFTYPVGGSGQTGPTPWPAVYFDSNPNNFNATASTPITSVIIPWSLPNPGDALNIDTLYVELFGR